MLKFNQFIKESEDRYNFQGSKMNLKGEFDKFTSNSSNLKYLKSFVDKEGDKDSKDLISKFSEYKKFRDEADYLRKEPKYINQFFKFKEVEGATDQELRDLYKNIQQHRNTLKQNQVDLTKLDTIEQVHDQLQHMELIEKTNRFIKLLPAHLRQDIKSDDIYLKRFSSLLIGYSYEDYKNSFLKKVAKYKTPNQFFEALESHLASFVDKKDIFNNVENHPGAEIVMSDDTFLVARIYSRKASCDLGSQQWCISGNGGSYWDNYISKRNGGSGKRPGVQYFIWDFNEVGNSSKIGATVYTDNSVTSYDNSDNQVKITNKRWRKYLINFNELPLEKKVRLIADNMEIEEYTGIINSLDDSSKRRILNNVPKLLLHFKDLSFLTNDEIWNLVKKDEELGEKYTIAKELSNDQKIYMVVKYPDLLEKTFQNEKNPYSSITNLLTRKQKLKMISNKHSLYQKFKNDLTEDELFEIIHMDPKILVTQSVIAQTVDQMRLKKEYLSNKDKWDIEISKEKGDDVTLVELLLSHLLKDDERIDLENTHNCYIYIGSKVNYNGKEYLKIEDNKIAFIDDILNPDNQIISSHMLMASFDDSLDGYQTWVRKELLTKKDLDINEEYIFKSDYMSLLDGTGDKREIEIYKDIIKNSVDLSDI